MTNTVLEKFHRGEPSLGTFTQMLSPIAAEILGYTGLDFVLIDMEHAPLSAQSAGELIAAARGSGITPLVRAREISRSAVLQPLDAGAMGVVVPCVETVDQVHQLVQWGRLGLCPRRCPHAGDVYGREQLEDTAAAPVRDCRVPCPH